MKTTNKKHKHTKKKLYILRSVNIILWTILAMFCGSVLAIYNSTDAPHAAITNDPDEYIMSFLGDSITFGKRSCYNYTQYLGAMCNADYVYNYGLSKNELATAGDADLPVCVRYEDVDPASDFIMVWAGTNDWYHNVVLGLYDDTCSSTFYGALRQTMTGLTECYPHARIVFVTPIKRIRDGAYNMANENGNTLEEYANAMIAVGEDYPNIEVLDLYHDPSCDFTEDTSYDTYWTDGLHPRSIAHEQIAARMYELLFPDQVAAPATNDLLQKRVVTSKKSSSTKKLQK